MKDAGFARVEKSDARPFFALLARSCSVALRAQCASVSLHAHTVPPSHAESIESAKALSSMWCPAGTPASPEGAHIASPQRRAAADHRLLPFHSRARHCHVTAQS